MVAIVTQHAVLFVGDNDLADFFLVIVVDQIVQFLVMTFVLAISWHREYVADVDVKRVIDSGDPLTHALEKIQQGNQQACESARTAQRSHGRARRDRHRDANVD